MKPAIRIILAPIHNRYKHERNRGEVLLGRALTPGRTVWLDPRTTDILATLIHEKAHIDHPDWDEKAVEAYTKVWMRKSGWKRKAAYLKLLGSALIEGEQV